MSALSKQIGRKRVFLGYAANSPLGAETLNEDANTQLYINYWIKQLLLNVLPLSSKFSPGLTHRGVTV